MKNVFEVKKDCCTKLMIVQGTCVKDKLVLFLRGDSLYLYERNIFTKKRTNIGRISEKELSRLTKEGFFEIFPSLF